MPPDGVVADPNAVATLDDLARELKKLRIASGAPSLATMERRAAARKLPLPTSTASNALSGRHLPGLDVVRAFVYACGAEAQEPEWKAAWERATAAHRPDRRRIPAGERIFPGVPPPDASRAVAMLDEMDKPEAVRFLQALEPARALDILAATETDRALEMLTLVKPKSAAKILKKLSPEDAAKVLNRITPEHAGQILDRMDADKAVQLLGKVDPERAAQALMAGLDLRWSLPLVQIEQAVQIVDLLEIKRVGIVFHALPIDFEAALLTRTAPERAAEIILELERRLPHKHLGRHEAARILDLMAPDQVERILALIDPKMVERIFHHDEYVFGMDSHDLH